MLLNKKIHVLLLLLLVFPTISLAYSKNIDDRCTTSIQVELRQKALEIYYKFERNEDNSFNLILYNVDDRLVIKYNNNTYKDIITNLKQGDTIQVLVYGSDSLYCGLFRPRTIELKVPYYNSYQNDPLCDKYPNYYLCDEFSNVNMTYEEFSKKMNEYINSFKKEDEEEVIEPVIESKTLWDYIQEYAIYIYFIILFILILIAFIIYKVKRNKIVDDF